STNPSPCGCTAYGRFCRRYSRLSASTASANCSGPSPRTTSPARAAVSGGPPTNKRASTIRTGGGGAAGGAGASPARAWAGGRRGAQRGHEQGRDHRDRDLQHQDDVRAGQHGGSSFSLIVGSAGGPE